MRVPELKALAKERGLRRYSKLRKTELIALLQTPPPAPAVLRTRRPRPNRPPPPPPSVPGRSDSPRQPELLEERPLTARQIKRRRNKINKLNKQIKSSERELESLRSERDSIINKIEGAQKFKSQRRKRIRKLNKELVKIDKSISKFEKVLDSAIDRLEPTHSPTKRIERKISELNKKIRRAKRNKVKEALIAKREDLRWKLADGKWHPEARVLEGAFGRAYRRYRIDGRPRMDPDTYFNGIKSQLILTLKKESKGRSIKIQTTTWIRFKQDEELVELAFNSRMTDVHNLSEVKEIVDEMINHMKEQVEDPALLNSRFVFDEVLSTNIDFHQLNLTRGSSYMPLPQWLANKIATINPCNEDQECFKWAVIAALRWEEIGNNPERLSKLKRFEKDFSWSGLKFPVSIKDIKGFEDKNRISINLLAIENREIYICRKGGNYKNSINLMIINNHYIAIKSLSRLLSMQNSKHKEKEYFCMNCLQGFHQKFLRAEHMKHCLNNESVKVEMPYKRSIIEFCDGQYQLKVPFIMYADFESLLEPIGRSPGPCGAIQGSSKGPSGPWTTVTNNHIPSGWCVYSKFAYGKVENPLTLSYLGF